MQKFMYNFFIFFVITISVMFFTLIGFQKKTMEKNAGNFSMPYKLDAPYSATVPGMPPPPPSKNPPVAVPVFLIIFLSSSFVFIFLKYLDKNFITPLVEIKKCVKKIKAGSLDVKFGDGGHIKSDNKTILETFKTLNSMVLGLKEKEKLRENFVSLLSHDLRTPILAQERAISILKDEFKGHELLDGMFENNKDYLSMINLIIETFSTGDVRIKKENLNLSGLVESVLLALKPSYEAKNINIITNIPKDFTIFADYISFHRVFMNLISNSIDNIENGKTIKTEALKNGDRSIITVFDNGKGIDSETMAHIFDKYASFKKADSKKTVSGLGLYIASELVKKNGGIIKAETAIGSFTKFIIEI